MTRRALFSLTFFLKTGHYKPSWHTIATAVICSTLGRSIYFLFKKMIHMANPIAFTAL